MKVLIDVSSVLWTCLLVGKDKEHGKEIEHEGKTVQVNGWQFGLDNAINHITSVMRALDVVPIDLIFVVEGQLSKARRRAIYGEYKAGRETRPAEAYVEFNLTKDALTQAFRDVGSQIVTQDGVEADDLLAYLAKHVEGEIVVLSGDGDMSTLIDMRVSLWQNGQLTKRNKYGPFPCQYVPVYKALVGDGNEYKGAVGFGPKAFLDMLVWMGDDSGLAALEGMIQRRELHELTEDAAEFKPFKKVVDGAKHVYESYECALLHDEWCDTKLQPVVVTPGCVMGPDVVTDQRLVQWANAQGDQAAEWWDKLHPPKVVVEKLFHVVFDIELIGSETPVFLVCTKIVETGELDSFWWHVDADMDRLHLMFKREELTWVSFNGIHFDAPLISAALEGHDPHLLKEMAHEIINNNGKSWQMPSQFDYTPIEFDHIDLMEVAPGVRTSLKAYAGRMGYPTMVDLPFHHDKDLSDDELLVLERYCQNDLGVTEALFKRLRTEIDLRTELSKEHGIDLRSKSDAQAAEVVLKKAAGIKGGAGAIPNHVTYIAPPFIETDSEVIRDLIEQLEHTHFKISKLNGQVESPEFLDEVFELGMGTYKFGVGGLHSTHDRNLCAEATEEVLISDFDVASYYPNIMLKAGLTPKVEGGARFIEEYCRLYDQRMHAKRSGNKKVANALKIFLNGTFGKLGSMYSALYAPELMLAVTLTGQLNLACLIHNIESRRSITVLSANTDGITVRYPAKLRTMILDKIAANARRTGFEYEETAYRKIAMKDVNNYLAITADRTPVIILPDGTLVEGKAAGGEAKRKGLYAKVSLMKNPTNPVCSNMAVEYLTSGIHPREAIKGHTDITDFVAIRAVKGGGIQHDHMVEVDDWVCVNDVGTAQNEWVREAWEEGHTPVRRKSRPRPVEVGVGGEPFGRIARWYMCNSSTMPISYAGSGNKVPKTDGAKVCMTLPDGLPDDLDYDWYVTETLAMLKDMGVVVPEETSTFREAA